MVNTWLVVITTTEDNLTFYLLVGSLWTTWKQLLFRLRILLHLSLLLCKRYHSPTRYQNLCWVAFWVWKISACVALITELIFVSCVMSLEHPKRCHFRHKAQKPSKYYLFVLSFIFVFCLNHIYWMASLFKIL